jgi:threonine dehydratase
VTVVMPATTNPLKVQATRGYGASIVQAGVDWSNRDEIADRLVVETGGLRNHADDDDELAGFGTIAVEVSQQVQDIDAILVPVSSGAVISGVAMGMRAFMPGVRVVGVEPKAAADARASLASGHLERLSSPPDTIADGARALSLTNRTFPLVTRFVDEIVTVSEEVILAATWWLWTRAKLVVEPTGALAYAAACSAVPWARRVVCVATGGNADVVDLGRRFSEAGFEPA